MNIAITGGAGFIGKYLVQAHLERGDEVRLLTRKSQHKTNKIELFVGDLQNQDTDLTAFVNNADILYHCAGELYDEKLMQGLHVFGTERLVKAAEGRIGRWVQLSSVGAYGKQRNGRVDETTNEEPIGTYEETKTQSDHIVKAAAEKAGMEYTILRPSIVFGEGMTNRSLFQMIDMIRRRLFFYIGKPGALMNYIHVKDVIQALLLCGHDEEANNNIFILSDSIKLEEMVATVSQALGVRQPHLRIPEWFVRSLTRLFHKAPGFPLTENRIDALTGRALYDSTKIKQKLGFEYSVTLMDAFREFAIATTEKE